MNHHYRSIFTSAVLAFSSVTALAFPRVVDIDAHLAAKRAGRPAELQIAITPHSDTATAGKLLVITRGDAAEPLSDVTEVSASPETTFRTTFQIDAASGDLGTIDIAYLPRTDATAAIQTTVYFERSGWRLHELAAPEYIAKLEAKQAAEVAARDEEEARTAIARMLAEGKRPAPVSDDASKLSTFDRAWNRLAQAYAPKVSAETCGVFNIVSSSNFNFPLNGNLGYIRYNETVQYDQNNNPYIVTAPWEQLFRTNGYSVSIETMVEYTDGCGAYQQRTKSYSVQSGSGGSVSYANVTSIVNPQTGNPIRKVTTGTGQVGVLSQPFTGNGNYGFYMAVPVNQTLTGSAIQYQWNGTVQNAGYMRPIYNSGNSTYPFFFGWQDELNKVRASWISAGIPSSFLDFLAGYLATDQNTSPYVDPSMRDIYGSLSAWVVFGPHSAEQVPYVMAHEFGHLFQYYAQNHTLCTPYEPPHGICSNLDPANAFNEGFADFTASKFETIGRSLFVTCSGAECQSACPTGYSYEGNVHDFLWDVFDNSNDATYDSSQDPVSLSLSILQNWSTSQYCSFPAFYNDFTARGRWSPYTSQQMDALRVMDAVDQQ